MNWAARVLVRLPGLRSIVAAGIRASTTVASLARRAAALDSALAERAGVRASGSPRPSCPLAISPPSPPPKADLDEIPSETSASERRFLYAFFAHLWRAEADVVEVGPFLGGTTRAIALGMLANPRCRPEARIYAYDRFDGYWGASELAELLEPLFSSGVLSEAERRTVMASGSFRAVFDCVHRGTPYEELVEARNLPLPDSPAESARAGRFQLDPGVEVDAVFVDGCKSWYATKEFMRAVLAAARPGSHVIFQDYGWYTCFWLPAFVHAMGGALVPLAWVDTTYAFHIAEPLGPEAVEASYPDDPGELGSPWFKTAFDTARGDAAARGDNRGAIVLGLQHAAALAYLGDADGARARIAQVRQEAGRASELRGIIAAARRSPTYRPGGEPVRL